MIARHPKIMTARKASAMTALDAPLWTVAAPAEPSWRTVTRCAGLVASVRAISSTYRLTATKTPLASLAASAAVGALAYTLTRGIWSCATNVRR